MSLRRSVANVCRYDLQVGLCRRADTHTCLVTLVVDHLRR